MRLGYFTMPLHPPGSDPAQTLADDLEQIVTLDRLGFDEAWIGEHFTSEWENIPCPDLFIAQALGAHAHASCSGTGVSCLPNHHPLMLAQRIAQLDQMARGRFLWGVGSGGFPGDFELFGIDPKSGEQRPLTRDVARPVLDLWGDPQPGVREPARWRFRVPEPQEDIGAAAPPAALPAAPPADRRRRHRTALGHAGPGRRAGLDPDEHQHRPAARRSGPTGTTSSERRRPAAGRSRDVAHRARRLRRRDDRAGAARGARRQCSAATGASTSCRCCAKTKLLGAPKIDPAMPDDEVTLEYLCDNIWIVGDVDEVAAKLARLVRDVGGFGTLLVIGHEWPPRDAWQRSMRLLRRRGAAPAGRPPWLRPPTSS